MSKKWMGLILIVCALSLGEAAGGATEQPNILFVLIDDMGWMDLGCYGNQLHRTPNIDRLAAEGIRFTQAYAAAHICSPTRGSIMTGKFPARTHITDWIPGWKKPEKLSPPDWQKFLKDEEFTLGEMLQQAGYKTAWLGKWHLNEVAERGGSKEKHGDRISTPQQEHGFDAGTQNWLLNSNKNSSDPKGVFQLTREALDFMDAAEERPWFIGLSHYSVHSPKRFNDTVRQKYMDALGAEANAAQAGYAAMVDALDESIGQLMTGLKERRLDENTLVVFFSDNGGLEGPTSNAPLRAGKGTLYDGGTRVPMIVRWPGKVPQGKISDAMICSIDFYPTFAAVAGVNPLKQQADGMNVLDHFVNNAPVERDALYWHYPHYHKGKPGSSIRKGDYKLIEFFENGKLELYNLKNDLGEQQDLAGEQPERAAELLGMLKQWRIDVGAQMMEKNPGYKAEVGKKNKKKGNK
jgi:arylsulfatase A-like enzyme